MTMLIPGSEIFSSRPVDPEELRRSIPTGLVTHAVRPEKSR
jgi:N-methylhydantoinase B